MKLLLNVKTSHLTKIMAYDTETEVMGQRLYCLSTIDTKGNEYVRFGNKIQLMSMLIAYRTAISKDTQEAYDTYMLPYLKEKGDNSLCARLLK